MYTNIPGRPLGYASTILACIAVVVTAPIYVFYKKGPDIRQRSKLAQSTNQTREKSRAKRQWMSGPGWKDGTKKHIKEA